MVLGEWVVEDAGFFFEPGAHHAVAIAEYQLHGQQRLAPNWPAQQRPAPHAPDAWHAAGPNGII
jgi:hypothetical protein